MYKDKTEMGFNGEVFWPCWGGSCANPEDQTWQRKFNEEILDDNAVNWTGHLYKCQVRFANAKVVMTAALKKIESIKQRKWHNWKKKQKSCIKIRCNWCFQESWSTGGINPLLQETPRNLKIYPFNIGTWWEDIKL